MPITVPVDYPQAALSLYETPRQKTGANRSNATKPPHILRIADKYERDTKRVAIKLPSASCFTAPTQCATPRYFPTGLFLPPHRI